MLVKKIGLPTESTTGTTYIQYYCEYIKAVQKKMADRRTRLPLCIMVSNDTKVPTFKLLKDNKCFGLRRRQIFIVEQGAGVPALGDNDAKIVVENGKILTKPHGHGDIHALLYKDGITKKWEEEFGIKYMVMFQVSLPPFPTEPLPFDSETIIPTKLCTPCLGHKWTCIPFVTLDAWCF